MLKYLFIIVAIGVLALSAVNASGFTLENQRLNVGDSHTYTVDCPCDDLLGWAQWDKTYDPDKDIAIDVTLPDGARLNTANDPLNAKQIFIIGDVGPGTVVITVTNVGEKNLRYDFTYGWND